MMSNLRDYNTRYNNYLANHFLQQDEDQDEDDDDEDNDEVEEEEDIDDLETIEETSVNSIKVALDNNNQSQTTRRQFPASTKRAKYSRPCDGCSLKKVKCSGSNPCLRCISNNIPCTNNRIRKKCGPKPKTFKYNPINNSNTYTNSKSTSYSNIQKRISSSLKSDSSEYNYGHKSCSCDQDMRISLSQIVPSLQVYQTWYYGVWPVISVPQLISKLTSVDFGFKLSEETSKSYALCLAVSAAVSRQITFLSEKSKIGHVSINIDFDYVAKESVRIRDLYDHRLNPSYETLLTSFFLYVYYINVKNASATAIIYLREAISMAQILKLHVPKTYINKPVAEAHRLKKIFYLLLITERFMCIEDNVPVILDACVPYPSLEEEEYPELLSGFIELVHIFAIPDRVFFEKMIEYNDDSSSDNYKMFQSFFHDASKSLSESQIIEVDKKLRNISITQPASDIQKANILLSKSWMRSLTWHIAQKRGVLRRNINEDNCLSFNYPSTIANEFLKSTNGIPIYAFESNGPGVAVKLLEIASGLADSIHDLSLLKSSVDLSPCYAALSSIFSLVSKLKTDIILPVKLYKSIENIVLSRNLSSKINPILNFNTVTAPSANNERVVWDRKQSREVVSSTSPMSNKNMYTITMERSDNSIIRSPFLFHQDLLAIVDQTPTDFVTYQYSNTPPLIEEIDKND